MRVGKSLLDTTVSCYVWDLSSVPVGRTPVDTVFTLVFPEDGTSRITGLVEPWKLQSANCVLVKPRHRGKSKVPQYVSSSLWLLPEEGDPVSVLWLLRLVSSGASFVSRGGTRNKSNGNGVFLTKCFLDVNYLWLTRCRRTSLSSWLP